MLIFNIHLYDAMFLVREVYFMTMAINLYSPQQLISGLDLFTYVPALKVLQLVETKKLNVSWYVYTHESRMVLLASGMQCKTISGFQKIKMAEDARGRGKNKRMWSSIEENALVDILLEMQHSSWKCDTGYKTGYQSHIEKKMLERFPYSGLKGKLHIESKIKILKRQLGYTLEAQKQSGIGWNDDLKMITGDKDIFMSWAKGRDGASAIYMKPFPLYDKLCEIYSNDRASGNMSKGPGDGDIGHDGGNNNIDDVSISSSAQATESSGSRGERKRRRDVENDEIGTLSKALASLIEVEKESTLAMNEVNKSFMRDVSIDEKRNMLFETLTALGAFSHIEVIEALSFIGLDDKKVGLFFSMPDESKILYVRSQLKK